MVVDRRDEYDQKLVAKILGKTTTCIIVHTNTMAACATDNLGEDMITVLYPRRRTGPGLRVANVILLRSMERKLYPYALQKSRKQRLRKWPRMVVEAMLLYQEHRDRPRYVKGHLAQCWKCTHIRQHSVEVCRPGRPVRTLRTGQSSTQFHFQCFADVPPGDFLKLDIKRAENGVAFFAVMIIEVQLQ